MKKYKICVYAICKNEEKFVQRWMDSVKEADMVIVTDTGSEDSTVEKLREAGAVVYREKINPWRFDTARNIALKHVPEDTDICVSNDLDEIFEPGWREKLEAYWKPDCTRGSYLFTWSYDAEGNPNKQYPMAKIHQRHGFRWIHPVHEILEYNGIKKDKTVWIEGLVLNHYPDLSKPRGQYLPLLELSSQENPQDDRTMFWLGREYLYHGMYDLSIETLKKHLLLPTALWNEERCASMRYIASSYESKGNMSEAKAWLFKAVAECPDIREPYLDLARFGYRESNWLLTYAMVLKGLEITKKTNSYLSEPECRGYAFYDFGAISAFNLGLYEKSREFAVLAVKNGEGIERLEKNLLLIDTKIKLLNKIKPEDSRNYG